MTGYDDHSYCDDDGRHQLSCWCFSTRPRFLLLDDVHWHGLDDLCVEPEHAVGSWMRETLAKYEQAWAMVQPDKPIPAEVIQHVTVRAAGSCEACGGPLVPGSMTEGPAHHHRLLKSRGGNHRVANLMVVHASCHNVAPGSIHQNPARSERLGHMLKRREEPTKIRVIVARNLRELRS